VAGGDRDGGLSRVALPTAVAFAAWLLVALPATLVIFLNSAKVTTMASHDAVVAPALDGYATLDLGPYLPNLRYPSGTVVGAHIDLGQTNVDSYQELIDRYAFIGSQPEGQVARLQDTLWSLARQSAVRGALVGAVLPGLWFLLGRRRRDELFRHVTARRAVVSVTVTATVTLLVVQPWTFRPEVFAQEEGWEQIGEVFPDAPIPSRAEPLQIDAGLVGSGTRRLVQSAIDTYNKSLSFYRELTEEAAGLADQLRQPAEDETVALLVSDRHDNAGMDPVARAIAEAGGATVLLDAGDDTSTGEPWEAFSLDSLGEAFADFEYKYGVAGNHDNGEFVTDYLADLGFTMLNGEVVEGPAGIRLLGANDPRASGLGSWRDESGEITFEEQTELIAEAACTSDEAGERISTILVHDVDSGDLALERGCTDLVLGGHVHAQLGPTRVVGENGEVGYTYTNGTTGGAAYALAIGSKLRRNAQVTLVTYRDGRPVGLQPIFIRTVGDFQVTDYIPFDLTPEADVAGAVDSGADTDPEAEPQPTVGGSDVPSAPPSGSAG